jgi:hypothetical protein
LSQKILKKEDREMTAALPYIIYIYNMHRNEKQSKQTSCIVGSDGERRILSLI